MPYARKDIVAWSAGEYYHFYNRCSPKTKLFREEDNYIFVIRKVKLYCEELQLSAIAYCLMPNHYHFLIRQNGDFPAGLLPQRVFNAYTKAYNNRFGRTGTLFERRYQAKQIKENSHLLQLCRYIHANPVKDSLTKKLEDWPYSNYLEWICKRNGTLFDAIFVNENFHSPSHYIAFVDDFIQTRKLPDGVAQYINKIEPK